MEKGIWVPLNVGFRVSPSMHAALLDQAKFEDMPISHVVRSACRSYLEHQFRERGKTYPPREPAPLPGQLALWT